MTTNLDDTNMNRIQNYCLQTIKQLLVLAQTFARKSRRPPTILTCDDLLNAFECMNILHKQKLSRDEEHFLKNSFDEIYEVEYN